MSRSPFFNTGFLLSVFKDIVRRLWGACLLLILFTLFEVCNQLMTMGEPFIVIDKNADKIDEAIGLDFLAAIGDASDDDVLLKVGVKHAKSLVSAISDDSANVYLVLTARSLNEKLHIVARGADQLSRKKLERVGANKVVSPFEMGARRMATYAVNPDVVDLMEAFAPGGSYDLQVKRITIQPASRLIGKKLNESNIRVETKGAMVVGISKQNQKMEFNPSGDAVLENRDILLAIGNQLQLKALQQISEEA